MVPEPLRAWTDLPCAQGPGRTPDSPELQLHPPAVQQDGGGLVVDACERGSGGLKAKHFHSYAQVKGADKRNSLTLGEKGLPTGADPGLTETAGLGPARTLPSPTGLAHLLCGAGPPTSLHSSRTTTASSSAPRPLPLPKGWASRSHLNRSAAGSTHGLLALGLPSGSHSHTLVSTGLRAKTQT